MILFLRSMVFGLRPKPDHPQELSTCTACFESVTQFVLCVPSMYLRIRQWLFGHGWMPQAFLTLRPCGHVTTDSQMVASIAHMAYLMAQGVDLVGMEPIPGDELV